MFFVHLNYLSPRIMQKNRLLLHLIYQLITILSFINVKALPEKNVDLMLLNPHYSIAYKNDAHKTRLLQFDSS